jgi:hypothetical protein
MKEVHGSSERRAVSASVPSDFTEYAKGITAVSFERCGRTSAVPVAVRQ